MDRNQALALAMIDYYEGDPKRIQHFLKVSFFARIIAKGEALDDGMVELMEAAGLIHDIGIKPAEEKFGSCGGKLQEQEGPAPAEKMLGELGFPEEETDRLVYLIAHHHTYEPVDGIDHRILLEADFLVNLYEGNCPEHTIETAEKLAFRTETGIRLLRTMFAPREGAQQTGI